MAAEPRFLAADWAPPPGVRACVSLRTGGSSAGPWASLNLGAHVGDDPRAVRANRELLVRALQLPAPPQWLEQVHGTGVVEAGTDGLVREGDAAWTARAGVVCTVLTADCLPVVLAAADGSEVAVAHCGWRGLAAGVLGATVSRFRANPSSLRAWMGPAIGPRAFEVGAEVREAFLATARDADAVARVDAAFAPVGGAGAKFLADIYALARESLRVLGVSDVSGGGHCTVSDPASFYSYRRDGVTGRMATLAWIDPAGRRPGGA